MILEEFHLKGNVAILAGYGQSWLTYLSAALAEAGAEVVVTGPCKEEIENASDEIRRLGRNVLAIPLDSNSCLEIEAMAGQVMARFGKVDVLVNSHNLQFGKPFLEVSEAEWEGVIESNLTSVSRYCKAIGKQMVKQGSGSIVNIISGAGERGLPNGAAYCSSMGGIIQLTRALAMEWARNNVRVNAVGTGWMENGIREGQKDPLASYIPMRRRGKPEDIAPVVVFLASEASSYVTGHVHFVDGGVMARG